MNVTYAEAWHPAGREAIVCDVCLAACNEAQYDCCDVTVYPETVTECQARAEDHPEQAVGLTSVLGCAAALEVVNGAGGDCFSTLSDAAFFGELHGGSPLDGTLC